MADEKKQPAAQVEATDSPDTADERTLAERRDTEKALRNGSVARFFYPEHGVSIIAKDRAAADNELQKQLKEQSND